MIKEEISPQELVSLLTNSAAGALLLLDVREPWEWELTHIADSTHIPMNLIPLRHNELPDQALIVTICHHGVRSLQVAHFLRDVGFDQVSSLHTGIDGWSKTIDSSILRY